MMTAETAVIILTYNCEQLIQELLPKVLQHTSCAANTEIIIADNYSTDGTLDYVRAEHSDLRVIEFKENHGFAKGYDLAVRQVNAPFQVLLSCDVEVSENWLEPLVDCLKSNPRIGAVQPKVRSYHRRDEFEYAGAAGGYLDSLGYPFCRGRLFSSVEQDHAQYDDELDIFWASGCCFALKKEAYIAAGGLDDEFFAHMEEIDLCWRMQRLNYRIVACPKSVVYHIGGYKLAYGHPFKLFLNVRNNLCMLTKNLPVLELGLTLPFRFLLDWFLALYAFIKFGPASSVAVFRAQFDFLKKARYWRKRGALLNAVTVQPKAIESSVFSVAFHHFLLRKKQFNSL